MRKTTRKELLEKTLSQIEVRLEDYSTADLNTLAKILIAAGKEEDEDEVPKTTTVSQFLKDSKYRVPM